MTAQQCALCSLTQRLPTGPCSPQRSHNLPGERTCILSHTRARRPMGRAQPGRTSRAALRRQQRAGAQRRLRRRLRQRRLRGRGRARRCGRPGRWLRLRLLLRLRLHTICYISNRHKQLSIPGLGDQGGSHSTSPSHRHAMQPACACTHRGPGRIRMLAALPQRHRSEPAHTGAQACSLAHGPPAPRACCTCVCCCAAAACACACACAAAAACVACAAACCPRSAGPQLVAARHSRSASASAASRCFSASASCARAAGWGSGSGSEHCWRRRAQ